MEDAQGVVRGGCRECSCRHYVLPMVNRCDYCNHLPISHQELAAPQQSQQQTASTTKLASPRTKHLFPQQHQAPATTKPQRSSSSGTSSSSSAVAAPSQSSAEETTQTSTAAAAASLLAYVEAQLAQGRKNGTAMARQERDATPEPVVALASQSSVDELLALLRAHLAAATPPPRTAAANATPAVAADPPHTPSPRSLTLSSDDQIASSLAGGSPTALPPPTPSASAVLQRPQPLHVDAGASSPGPGLLPTPFPASPATAPPPTPPPSTSSKATAGVGIGDGTPPPAMTVVALARKKKTTAAAAATAVDAGQQLRKATTSSNNNRARRRGARGRSRSKLEIPGADAPSASATTGHGSRDDHSAGHHPDEEDEEVEADDAYEREDDGGETEYRDDHVTAFAPQSQESLQMAAAAPDATREETTTTATASSVQPEALLVRRNAGGRRRQQEKAEELIPLSFLTNAIFTPPQPSPVAPAAPSLETKRVKGMGTGDPKYSITILQAKCENKTLTFHPITAMPDYSGKSFEELRWEDHQLGNRGNQAQPSLFSLIDTSSSPYPLPTYASPATAAVDARPSPLPSLLPRSLAFVEQAGDSAAAPPPLDALPPLPPPVDGDKGKEKLEPHLQIATEAVAGQGDAENDDDEERIIYQTPKPLYESPRGPALPAIAPQTDVTQLAQLADAGRARDPSNRRWTDLARLYAELHGLVEQLGRHVETTTQPAGGDNDGDAAFEVNALLHRIHTVTRDYAFAPSAPSASLFSSARTSTQSSAALSPPLFALPLPPDSPYSPLTPATAVSPSDAGPAPWSLSSSGFSAPSPAPSAPVYTAYPAPISSPFALRSFPVPMEASYFKRYYYKGSYVPFLEDFAHEFKDVARNKKEHYYAIINHPKLEANLSAFLNSRDGGTLYFGIHDSGQVIGVSITRDQLDSLKNMIWAKMETFNPVPDPHLYRIEIVPVCNARGTALIKDLYVVEIHVTGGTRLYFNREDRAWVRRDAGNHCLKSGAEVRDFIEQRAKERRQEKRGEKRRPDHQHHESSSSIAMDTNRDDELRGGTPADGMSMRPVTPRDRRARAHSVSSTDAAPASTSTPRSTPSATTAAHSATSVPLLFPLRRPVHRDGRMAPVWLKSWSSSSSTDLAPEGGHEQTTAGGSDGDGDGHEADEAQWTVVAKKRKPTPSDQSGLSDSDLSYRQHTEQDEAADPTLVEEPAPREEDAKEHKSETPTAAAADDDPPRHHAIPEVAAGEDERAGPDTTEPQPTLHDEADERNWAKEMRDLEEDLERLSAETNALVSLSWPSETTDAPENNSSKATGALLLHSSMSSSERKEKDVSDLEPACDDAARYEDDSTASVNDAREADDDRGNGGQSAEETILPFNATARTNNTTPATTTSFHGALPPFSFADFSSSFFSNFSLPSSLYSPAPSSSSIPTLSSSSSSSSSSASATFSSPSSSSTSSPVSPALHSSPHGTRSSPASSSSPSSPSTRSLAAFLPSAVGAKTSLGSSPLVAPPAGAARLATAAPTHGDGGSPTDAGESPAQEKKVGKNRRKKEQRKASTSTSSGITPATTSTAENVTEDNSRESEPAASAAATVSTTTGATEDDDDEEEEEEEADDGGGVGAEAAMEAELDKLERELEEDRRQLVAQFASCFADLALRGGPAASSSVDSHSPQ